MTAAGGSVMETGKVWLPPLQTGPPETLMEAGVTPAELCARGCGGTVRMRLAVREKTSVRRGILRVRRDIY
jgi:hypothetical protein